jgi:hypothetical protein
MSYRKSVNKLTREHRCRWIPISRHEDARRYYGGSLSASPIPLAYYCSDGKTGERTISSQPLTNVTNYFFALHEVGHFATDSWDRRNIIEDQELIDQEINAWRWALENSEYKIPVATLKLAAKAFKSYISASFTTIDYSRLPERMLRYI